MVFTQKNFSYDPGTHAIVHLSTNRSISVKSLRGDPFKPQEGNIVLYGINRQDSIAFEAPEDFGHEFVHDAIRWYAHFKNIPHLEVMRHLP